MTKLPGTDYKASASESVTTVEVENFKLERQAEKEFLVELRKQVDSFGLRISPVNRMYRSMLRFLNSNK